MLTTVVGSKSAPHKERKPAVPISIDIRVKTTQKTIELSATKRMHTKTVELEKRKTLIEAFITKFISPKISTCDKS